MTYRGYDVDEAFRIRQDMTTCTSSFFAICIFCEQNGRTERNQRDRWREKMIRTRKTHSIKLGISVEDLEHKYGWVIEQMRHDAMFQYQNGCSECHRSFASMDHGLADITLDIWDPRVEPFYGVNTRWVDMTCNRAKGTMVPERWAIRKRLWLEHEAFLAEQSVILKPVQMEFALNA